MSRSEPERLGKPTNESASQLDRSASPAERSASQPDAAAHALNGSARARDGSAHTLDGSAHAPNGSAHTLDGSAHTPPTVDGSVGKAADTAGPAIRRLSRRGVLRIASLTAVGLATPGLGSAVAGCSAGSPARGPSAATGSGTTTGRPPPGGPTGPPDGSGSLSSSQPDVLLALAAAADEAGLRDACLEAMDTTPKLRPVLQPLAGRLHEHTRALHRAVEPSGYATPTPSSPVTPTRGHPADLSLLVDDLVTAQRRRLADCLAADSGPLARLMASISASHAQSLLVLRRLQ